MTKHILVLIAALAAPIVTPADDDFPLTRQQGDDILRELQQIRILLQHNPDGGGGTRTPAPSFRNISLTLEKARFLGSASAPLTIVEVTDLQCPYCQRFHLTAFNDLKQKYIDTGIARFYSRDLPLDIDRNALRAAQASRCAGDQGLFWEMRNLLQSNPEKLELDNLNQYAGDLKLDRDKFQLCVSTERHRIDVEADIAQAKQIGVEATPTFVIGTSTPDGVTGQLLMGALPFDDFAQRLDELKAK